jgi:putative Ig domain-containing protein
MRALWRLAAALTVVLLCGFTCVTTAQKNNIPPPTPSSSPTPPPSPTQASTPASITGIPLVGGEVGITYTASLGASGGASPYTWGLDSGALPGGLTLGADGSVTGVPSAAGTFNFTVKASDADNQYTTQGATIKIAAHLTAALIPACAQSCYVEQGCVNVCGNFGSQSGGVGPFTYQGSGNIPGGMKLSGLSLAGSFPQLAQFWQFNVTITDALGATASLSPIFYVFRHITITKTSWLCGNSPSSCQLFIPYVGGTPNGRPTFKVIGVTGYAGRGGALIGVQLVTGACGSTGTTSPPPPQWQTVSAGGGTLTYTLQNPNRNQYPCYYYSGRITIELVDQSPCGSPANCTSNTAIIDISV